MSWDNQSFSGFLARREELSLAVFRMSLAGSVRYACPIVSAELARAGMTLDDAVGLLRPTTSEPRLSNSHLFRYVYAYRQMAGWDEQATREYEDTVFAVIFRQRGIVVRAPSDHHGAFGLRIAEGWIAGEIRRPHWCLRTKGGPGGRGVAELVLDPALGFPDTVAAALPGQAIGRLFDHPLFACADYVVAAVSEASVEGRRTITFSIPGEPYRIQVQRAARPARRRRPAGGRTSDGRPLATAPIALASETAGE